MMRSRSLRVASRAIAGALLAVLAGATAAAAAPRGTVARSGAAVIVDGAGSSRPLSHGGSATGFSLRLPPGAECPGDSADAGYRVQSFFVPASDDPGSFTYYSVMPVGKGRYALYDVYSNPYIQEQTARATSPGGPGPIVDVPAFNFAVFPVGMIKPGRYQIGIACSLSNATKRYWSTSIEIAASATDRPAQLRWRALDNPTTSTSSGTSAGAVLAAIAIAVAVLVVGWRLLLRRTGART